MAACTGSRYVSDRVAHFAKDLVDFRLGIPAHADMFANGVVAREKLIDEQLAHHHVTVVPQALMFGKDPAAHKGNLHHAEVLRVRGKGRGIVLSAVTGCGPLRDRENSVVHRPVPGAMETSAAPRTPGSRRTRSSSDSWKRHHVFARIVLDFGQAEFHCHHVVDTAAQIC